MIQFSLENVVYVVKRNKNRQRTDIIHDHQLYLSYLTMNEYKRQPSLTSALEKIRKRKRRNALI